MREFTILEPFGIPLRLRLSFFASATALSCALGFGYFPRIFPELPGLAHGAMALLATISLFATVYLHELAHALEARRQGIEVRGIALFALGGVAEIASEPRTARGELTMAAAGPLVSVAIAFGCAAVLRIDRSGRIAPPLAAVLEYLGIVNLGIAGFNLLPAFPLDGGRLLRAAIWRATGSFERATGVATLVGRGFAAALAIAGGVLGATLDPIGGIWLVVVAVFIYQAASAAANQLRAATFRAAAVDDVGGLETLAPPPAPEVPRA
jgi:Zn-dependent protease